MRKAVMSKKAGRTGPYSHAIDAGDYVFLSGQTPINPETGELVEADITVQKYSWGYCALWRSSD